MATHRYFRAVLSIAVACVFASTVLPATAAHADAGSVLILNSTVSGGATSVEVQEVQAQGYTPVLVDDVTWGGMTTAQFASYHALVLGDPTCSGAVPSAAVANAATWGSAINGSVVVNGTDPVYHKFQGGSELTQKTVDFALSSAAGKTGAYISLSCYYANVPAHTSVPLLDALRPGGFTVTGVGCYNNAHIVATHPALAGLSDVSLSNWNCSVHEAFDSYPPDYTVLAIAKDYGSTFTASDGTVGTPYILASGAGLRSFPLSIDPTGQTDAVGSSASMTAQLLDSSTSAPFPGQALRIALTGPNVGAVVNCTAGCITDAAGHVTVTYTGTKLGQDTLRVFVDTNGDGLPSPGEFQTTAGITWTNTAVVEPAAQLLFLHGVTSNAKNSFTPAQDALRSKFTAKWVTNFVYYQDVANKGVGGDCDTTASAQQPPTRPDNLAGMPYDESQNSTAICDSQGSVAENAIRLDDTIKHLYASNHKKVILVGYSMGGQTIRTFLAYSTKVADGVAANDVDSVITMHGVEQGSWLATFAAKSNVYDSLYGPYTGTVLSHLASALSLPDPTRLASVGFSPESLFQNWVDTNSDALPDIPTYNTWGDERITVRHCFLPFGNGCVSSDTTKMGDVVLLPGNDSPTSTPATGGERFLPGGKLTTQHWQWAETDRIGWDPLNDPLAVGAISDLLTAPEMHANYPASAGKLTIKDCRTGGPVNEEVQIEGILTARMIGTAYPCNPASGS